MGLGESPSYAAIGDSIDMLRRAYGREAEISTYRPDLYATSYKFKKDTTVIEATILPDRASKIDVFFETKPSDNVVVLLERYSGAKDWKSVPTSDQSFARHFPLFNTERNLFYIADGLAAMVQRNVDDYGLVLWIQTETYPDLYQ